MTVNRVRKQLMRLSRQTLTEWAIGNECFSFTVGLGYTVQAGATGFATAASKPDLFAIN